VGKRIKRRIYTSKVHAGVYILPEFIGGRGKESKHIGV